MTNYAELNVYLDSEFSNNVTPINHGWDYQPIKTGLKPVAIFDSEILPDAFQAFVDDASHRMQSPPDFIAVGLMVALSSLVGRKVEIYPKQKDNWLITPNLWGAIVGRPSTLKSPSLNEALKPIAQLEVDAGEDYKQALAEHGSDDKLQKMLLKDTNSKAQKAVKEGNTEEAKKIIRGSDNNAPEIPIRKRYKVNDSTVEKLGELLSENSNGLMVERDEITGLLKHLDKTEYSADRAFYLQAWNGNQGFTYDRIGRGTIEIVAVTLSIIGGIQPSILKTYINNAISGQSGDDGLLQRFQLLVYPDIKKNWQYIDKAPNKLAIDKAYKVFEAINTINPDSQIKVRFSTGAQTYFVEWLTELEGKLRNNNYHPAIESHLTKYRSLIPSLALIIHIADHPDKFAESVGEKALLKALEWGDYLESHAMRIYGIGIDSDNDNALLIAERFNKLGDSFTKRDIQRKGWTGLKNNSVIQTALDLLVSNGYLKERQEVPTNGRPTTTYMINPRLEADNG